MALDRETPGSPTSFLVFLPRMSNFCLLTFTSKGLLLTTAIADFTGPFTEEGPDAFFFRLAAFPISARAARGDAGGKRRLSPQCAGPSLEVRTGRAKWRPGGRKTPQIPPWPDPCPPLQLREGSGVEERAQERREKREKKREENYAAPARPSTRRAQHHHMRTGSWPPLARVSPHLAIFTALLPARFGTRPGKVLYTTYPSRPATHRARVLSAHRALPAGTCSPCNKEREAAQGRCCLRRAEEPWPGRAGAARSPSPPSGRGSAVPGRAAGDGEEASAVLRSSGAG